MITKIIIILILFIVSCKATETQIKQEVNSSNKTIINSENHKKDTIQEEKKANSLMDTTKENTPLNTTTSFPSEEKENVSTTDLNRTNSSIDSIPNILEENLIKDEDKEIITFYKKQYNVEEERYFNDKRRFYDDRNFILYFKNNSELENQSYEEYKTSYKRTLEEKKQKRIEILNQIDPERKAFWRLDSNLLFDELLYFNVSKNHQYKLCFIENPYEFIYYQEIKMNKCTNLKNIDVNLLKNKNFFEEISIFELIPKKKGYYVIFEENNNELSNLKIRDKNNEIHFVSFIESDGSDLIKIYVYNILKKQNQNRIYFKIISPLDLLFRLSE